MTDAERLARHAVAVAEGRQPYDPRDFAVPPYKHSLLLRSYRRERIYWRREGLDTVYIVDEKEFPSQLYAERYIDEKVERELRNPPMHLIAKFLPPGYKPPRHSPVEPDEDVRRRPAVEPDEDIHTQAVAKPQWYSRIVRWFVSMYNSKCS